MNKRERMTALINGERTDCVPAGFWFHYGPGLSVSKMIERHMELFHATDMDVIKIMQEYMYPVTGKINCADDWRHIGIKGTDSEEFHKMTEIIRGIREKAGENVQIYQTMFGPFKAASFAFGDDTLMKYSRSDPEAVAEGIRRLADGLAKWTEGYLNAGADGIYYSAQFGEAGRFTKAEWEKLVKPSDLQVLNVAKDMKDKYNILHICGEPEYDFKTNVEWFKDYPGDLVNWSVKDNHFSLKDGSLLFKRSILGGMNNKGNILKGPKEKIRKEVTDILDDFGTKRIMIGADCTIQGEGISLDFIKEAVDAAHDYR